jgi:hypothetical protein
LLTSRSPLTSRIRSICVSRRFNNRHCGLISLDIGRCFRSALARFRPSSSRPRSRRLPGPRKSKIKLALGIGVPFGIVIGSVLSSRRKRASQQPEAEGDKPAKPGSERPGSDQPG